MEVTINTPFIKLDALLKFANLVSSGGEASILIADGQVRVNQVVELRRGKKIMVGDTVSLNDTVIMVRG